MAKRFTATDKWFDPWFRELPVEYKAFWIYLCDQCDNSGVWKSDFKFASYVIGQPVDAESAVKHFGDRVTRLRNDYLLVRDFVAFQYGELTTTSRPHMQVLTLIDKHRVSKGYPSPIHRAKDKDKDKDKETFVFGDSVKGEQIPPPSKVREWFEKTWSAYPKERRVKKKAAFRSYQTAVKTLEEAKLVARALETYLKSKTVQDGYIQNASTFFSNWEDFKSDDEPRNSPGVPHAPIDGRPSSPSPREGSFTRADTPLRGSANFGISSDRPPEDNPSTGGN